MPSHGKIASTLSVSLALLASEIGGGGVLRRGIVLDVDRSLGVLSDPSDFRPSATLPHVAKPTFSVASGKHTSAQSVKITDSTKDATIYFSLDGSAPTSKSAKYKTALTIADTTTVKAIGVAPGYANSSVASATYIILKLQTITFKQPTSPLNYGVKPIALSATASSGLPVTFSVLSGPAKVSAAKLNIIGVGTVIVAANQAGDAKYSRAPQVTRSITVKPAAQAGAGEWTWMSGSDTINASGVYGTLGTASSRSVPGARSGAISWKDGSENLWLFGGGGLDSTGASGALNDLWRFNPTNNEWKWVSGSSSANARGVYQAQGVAATANVPGSRANAVSWSDRDGNLWLFGGECFALDGEGVCNDLWKFDTTTEEWTWMSGSNATYADGVYGTRDVSSSSNVPGARSGAASWTGRDGNLWLFGGGGLPSVPYDPTNPPDSLLYLNDLWEYSPAAKAWTWVSGSKYGEAIGVYGTRGIAAANNVPGSRLYAATWTDNTGNLWLFGGTGVASASSVGSLDDLWEFNTTTREWIWVSGSDRINAGCGVFGTRGRAAATNAPGDLVNTVSWIDTSGNLWLFGGSCYASPLTPVISNDLWQFSTTTKQWTWMSGSGINTADTSGDYGTIGVPFFSNVPGARESAIGWTDSSGDLWLFGGVGYDSKDTAGGLNDLWRFEP
jgi:N-acetylneuraminic acid mutarotase